MRLTTTDSAAYADQPWVRTDEPLLWLIGSGHETITPETAYWYDCRKRGDAHLGLQLTLAGEGFYERGGRQLRVGPGAAWFDAIPGDFRYGLPLGAAAAYEHVWIDLQGPTAHRLWERVRAQHGPVLELGPDNPVAPLMLELAHEHAAGMLGDRYLVSARVYALLMTLLSTVTRARVTTSPLARRALDLIHRRGLRPDFDVAALAREMGCSREHLSRGFAAAIGVAPKAYLLQHRLRRAQRELRGSRDGLDAIARRCGFASANYFVRAFRARFGVTPGAWRERPSAVRADEADPR